MGRGGAADTTNLLNLAEEHLTGVQTWTLIYSGSKRKGRLHFVPFFPFLPSRERRRVSRKDFYELKENTFMIWGGEKGSPAFFKGTFSPDGNTCTGAWVFPGGGYSTTMTRVTSA